MNNIKQKCLRYDSRATRSCIDKVCDKCDLSGSFPMQQCSWFVSLCFPRRRTEESEDRSLQVRSCPSLQHSCDARATLISLPALKHLNSLNTYDLRCSKMRAVGYPADHDGPWLNKFLFPMISPILGCLQKNRLLHQHSSSGGFGVSQVSQVSPNLETRLQSFTYTSSGLGMEGFEHLFNLVQLESQTDRQITGKVMINHQIHQIWVPQTNVGCEAIEGVTVVCLRSFISLWMFVVFVFATLTFNAHCC